MRQIGVFVVVSGLATAASAQITDLGATTPYGVSDNGLVACGISGQSAMRWSVAGGGVQTLPFLQGHTVAYALAASLDGSVITGYSQVDFSSDAHAVIWSGGTVTDLGSLASGGTAANDISADGLTVVGASGSLPFRWTSVGGMQNLGMLAGWNSATPSAVNSNGTIIAGVANATSGRKLFRWTSGGGMQELTTLAGNAPSAAGVSENGQIIAGVSGTNAYRWTQAGGLQDLGVLPGFQRMTITGMTPDGSAIVGYASIASFPTFINEAVIWTQATGMVGLESYLNAQGVSTTDWELQFGFGVSANGRAFVGLGAFQGQERGFIVSIPGASCYANCDGSTTQPVLNVADFTCFLQRYAAGDSYANCDGSTTQPVLNVADFTCFLQRYAAGCR
jgi:probable HAF family extracellular repeat protein